MAELLSYEGLKDMKLADYKKAFKNKAQWKKAKAVFFILDYKLDGKKVPVAIPLKRPAELKKLFKTVKADKHPTKKIGGGSLKSIKGPEGMQFEVDLSLGGLDTAVLEKKAGKLFKQLLKVDLVSTMKELLGQPDDDQEEDQNHLEEPLDGEQQEDEPIINQDNQFSEKEKEAIKNLVKSIKEGINSVKTEVVPSLKAKDFVPAHRDLLQDVLADLDEFEENYEIAPAPVQAKLEKFNTQVMAQKGQLQKMLKKLEAEVEGSLDQILTPEQREEIINTSKAEVEAVLKELEELKALL